MDVCPEDLEHIIDIAPCAAGLFSHDARPLFLNSAYYRLVGYLPEEYQQIFEGTDIDLLYRPDLQILSSIKKTMQQDGNIFGQEFRIVRKDRNVRWIRLHSSPVALLSGKAVICYFEDVTEEKERTTQMDLIADNSGASVSIFRLQNGKQELVYGNKEFFRLIGKDKIAYQNNTEELNRTFVDKANWDRTSNAWEGAVKSGEPIDFEYQFKGTDGKERWMNRRMKAVAMDSPDTFLMVSIVTDISEKKKREEEEKEARIRKDRSFWELMASQEGVRDESLLYDMRLDMTNGEIVKDNVYHDCCPFSHRKAYGEFLAAIADLVLDEKDRNELVVRFSLPSIAERYGKGETESSCLFTMEGKDISIHWIELKCLCATIPGTEAKMAFLKVFDRTDAILEQNVLKRISSMEHDYLAVIDIRLRKIFMTNVKENARSTNPRKTADYDEDCAFAVQTIVVPEDRERVLSCMALENILSHVEKDGSYSFSFSVMEIDGGRLRKSLNYLYLDGMKTSLLMTRTDITAVYETEQIKNRTLAAALERAQKADKAKSEFLSNMSHEIRTPMNTIIGLTRLSEDEKDVPPLVKDYLGKIDASSVYLLSIINDILDMSKIENGTQELHKEWTTSREVVGFCIAMIKPLMDAKHICFTTPSVLKFPTDFQAFADVQKSRQMLMNLLNNAWKFTPEGGHVELSFRSLSHDGRNAVDQIIVKDDGCGMSKEFLKIAFDPFTQERNASTSAIKGTGLGLSLTKQIAKAMGGDISVESELGKGSTFTITFPYEYRRVEETPKEGTEKHAGSSFLEGKRILLAEDHPLNAMIAERLLEKAKMEVVLASDGKRAVDDFQLSSAHEYDAILMDIRMPVMDGLEAARKIRSLLRKDAKKIPIIAMSANAYSEDVKKSLDAGMDAHLSKPIDQMVLYRTLEQCIKQNEGK